MSGNTKILIIASLVLSLLSFLITAGLFWVMCWAFSWAFSWKVAVGIYAIEGLVSLTVRGLKGGSE